MVLGGCPQYERFYQDKVHSDAEKTQQIIALSRENTDALHQIHRSNNVSLKNEVRKRGAELRHQGRSKDDFR